jgi:hypothetical protein
VHSPSGHGRHHPERPPVEEEGGGEGRGALQGDLGAVAVEGDDRIFHRHLGGALSANALVRVEGEGELAAEGDGGGVEEDVVRTRVDEDEHVEDVRRALVPRHRRAHGGAVAGAVEGGERDERGALLRQRRVREVCGADVEGAQVRARADRAAGHRAARVGDVEAGEGNLEGTHARRVRGCAREEEVIGHGDADLEDGIVAGAREDRGLGREDLHRGGRRVHDHLGEDHTRRRRPAVAGEVHQPRHDRLVAARRALAAGAVTDHREAVVGRVEARGGEVVARRAALVDEHELRQDGVLPRGVQLLRRHQTRGHRAAAAHEGGLREAVAHGGERVVHHELTRRQLRPRALPVVDDDPHAPLPLRHRRGGQSVDEGVAVRRRRAEGAARHGRALLVEEQHLDGLLAHGAVEAEAERDLPRRTRAVVAQLRRGDEARGARRHTLLARHVAGPVRRTILRRRTLEERAGGHAAVADETARSQERDERERPTDPRRHSPSNPPRGS